MIVADVDRWRRLSPLLDELLDLPPAERGERVAALRGADPAAAAELAALISQGNGKSLTAAELLARAEDMTEQQFANDPLTRGRLQLLIATEYGNVLDFERSKTVLGRAQAAARAANNAPLLSNVECLLAATLGDQNGPQRGFALFEAAIRRLHDVRDTEGSVLAHCLHMRADLHAHMGQPGAMLADAQAALAALGTPRDDERVLANSIRIVIAEAHGRLGQTADAIAAYEKSLADLATMARSETARTVIRINNFSRMLYVAGLPLRGEAMAARGLAISRSSGAGHEIDAILEGNRARSLFELGRYDEARQLSEHALASALERNDLRWAGTFALYGAPAACAAGDAPRCSGLLAIALEKLKAALPPGHSNFGAIDLVAAQLALIHRQPETARQHLAHALAIFDAASDRNPLRIRALTQLAALEREQEPTAAARHAELAVAAARELSRGLVSSVWLGIALTSQAESELARGDPAVAQATLREAVAQLVAAVGDDAPATRAARALLDGI